MNSYNITKSLFSKKKCNYNLYSSYIINRYISFIDDGLCIYVNETLNKIQLDDDRHYNFLFSVLPKLNKVNINYIKKHRNTHNQNENDSILKLYELSRREYNMYKDMFNLE